MNDREASIRRQIRAGAAGVIPADSLDLVVDLAMHAVTRAFEAVDQVTRRAQDPRVVISASGIAFSIIAAEAPAKVEALIKSAGALGMTSKMIQVQGGAAQNG